MNKIQIVFLASILCSLVSGASYTYTKKEFWTTCNAQLTAYSVYANTATTTIQTALGNVFTCALTFQTQTSRNVCETSAGLATLDVSAQKYYSDCIIPYADAQNGICIKDSSCATQSDKCQTCLSASTCNSFRQNGSALETAYLAASTTPGCASAVSNCPATLTPIVLSSCTSYFQDQCKNTWIMSNPSDPCVDAAICWVSSGSIISVSIIALLALLAF